MITGYVLAGGQSSRMGRDKALLTLNGETWLERAVRCLSSVCSRVRVIGPRRHPSMTTLSAVDDLAPGFGPLMGIYTGLMVSETRLNLFVSCDMPFLDSSALSELLNCWQDGAEAACYANADGTLQPLPLVCDARATRSIGRLLNQKRLSLTGWILGSPHRTAAIRDSQLAFSLENINTPEALERFNKGYACPR